MLQELVEATEPVQLNHKTRTSWDTVVFSVCKERLQFSLSDGYGKVDSRGPTSVKNVFLIDPTLAENWIPYSGGWEGILKIKIMFQEVIKNLRICRVRNSPRNQRRTGDGGSRKTYSKSSNTWWASIYIRKQYICFKEKLGPIRIDIIDRLILFQCIKNPFNSASFLTLWQL